jgi:hypothetical protein
MNNLSSAARAMLGRGEWHDAVRDRQTLVKGLVAEDAPVVEPPLRFQETYGGLEYDVRGNFTGFYFDMCDFDDKSGVWLPGIVQEDDGQWLFGIGYHATAQIGFFMLESGTICVAEGDVVPIATSIEKYIESDAMIDELMSIQPKWWLVPLGDMDHRDQRLDAIAARGRSVIEVASDQYTLWWADEHSRIRRCVFYTLKAGTDVGFGYFRSADRAREFLAKAQEVGIAGKGSVLPHPRW